MWASNQTKGWYFSYWDARHSTEGNIENELTLSVKPLFHCLVESAGDTKELFDSGKAFDVLFVPSFEYVDALLRAS